MPPACKHYGDLREKILALVSGLDIAQGNTEVFRLENKNAIDQISTSGTGPLSFCGLGSWFLRICTESPHFLLTKRFSYY